MTLAQHNYSETQIEAQDLLQSIANLFARERAHINTIIGNHIDEFNAIDYFLNNIWQDCPIYAWENDFLNYEDDIDIALTKVIMGRLTRKLPEDQKPFSAEDVLNKLESIFGPPRVLLSLADYNLLVNRLYYMVYENCTPEETKIIHAEYFACPDLTISELAAIRKVSEESLHKIRISALQKLKEKLFPFCCYLKSPEHFIWCSL